MKLTTINDLITLPADELLHFFRMAEGVLDMYEEFIRQDERDVHFIAGWHGAGARSAGIHASELSGDCLRAVCYSIQGETRNDGNLDPFWKKRFRVGHTYHALVQDDFRRMCEQSGGMLSCQSEVTISPDLQGIAEEFGISSSCDLALNFHEEPWGPIILRLGIEIKTESGPQFELLKGPKPMHLRQTNVYQRCLDVPLMWTMYHNKSNQNIVPSKHPYLFAFDFDLWEETVARMNTAHHHVRVLNKLPARVEGIGCEFCGYGHICQPEWLQKKQRRADGKKLREAQAKRLRKVGRGGIRI